MNFPRFFSRPTPHDHARALGTLGGKATDTGECFAPRHSGFAPSRQSTLPSRPFGECRLSQGEE
jgi:hypothetical protein